MGGREGFNYGYMGLKRVGHAETTDGEKEEKGFKIPFLQNPPAFLIRGFFHIRS